MVLQRPGTETFVYLDGSLRTDLHPRTVQLSAGGGRLDTAVMELLAASGGLPTSTGRLVTFADRDLLDFSQAECEIAVQTFAGGKQWIHAGHVVAQELSLAGDGQTLLLISRLESHDFGSPLEGIRLERPGGAEIFPYPLVFNPEYDGRATPNCFFHRDPKRLSFHLPESLAIGATRYDRRRRILTSETPTGDAARLWTLPLAASYLCWALNAAETFVLNPDPKALASVLPADVGILRSHQQPFGQYLPRQLDELLAPYGFGWTIDYLAQGKRRIRIYRRGGGASFGLKLQAAGEDLDLEASNVEQLQLSADVSSGLVNEVSVLGDFEHIEGTFELVPAWSQDYDAADIETLSRDCDAWPLDPKLARVGRDWVLNENGDYNDTRPGAKTYDLSAVLGAAYAVRRRRFFPCITLGDDGNPIGQTSGLTVEFWDGSEWRPVDEISGEAASVAPLDKECGIRFTGKEVPYELWDFSGIAPLSKVRVTATIVSDQRVGAFAADSAKRVLQADKRQTLELPARFKYREVHTSSIYSARVRARTLKSSERNDQVEAQALAEELLNNWNQASVHGPVTITGCGFAIGHGIGRPIAEVSGRNIGLRTAHQNAAAARFPTVVGAQYDFANETISLVLDTFRADPLG